MMYNYMSCVQTAAETTSSSNGAAEKEFITTQISLVICSHMKSNHITP